MLTTIVWYVAYSNATKLKRARYQVRVKLIASFTGPNICNSVIINHGRIYENKIRSKIFIDCFHLKFKGTSAQSNPDNSYYDGALGVFVNMDSVDRDTGDYKYQRRPLFEWLARWLK